ncbi:MAG: hypothetical protein J6R49_02220 [Clostridia bacterium]|nr:hypothetical protein [Clostridia bacterium]
MSSAFRNFFITFAVCLLVFGFVGLKFIYPWVSDIVNFSDMGTEESTDISTPSTEESEGEESTVTTPADDEFDENGDVFTAVIMCVDSKGAPLSSVFIDSNAKSKQFIYCPLAPTLKAYNEVGVLLPLNELFVTMDPKSICQSVTAMTGIETKYCLSFTREDMAELVSLIPGASVTLGEDIIIVNPLYADYIPVFGQPYPDDYYITISNVDGKVLLGEELSGKTKLEWLLEYNPSPNGAEYNALYTLIAKSLLKQFFANEDAMKSTETMARLLAMCDTNLTLDAASGHLETIFSYDNFRVHETTYPSTWESAIVKLRELDGSYNK